jgi:hypothetical protein
MSRIQMDDDKRWRWVCRDAADRNDRSVPKEVRASSRARPTAWNAAAQTRDLIEGRSRLTHYLAGMAAAEPLAIMVKIAND